ncbi:hypothetical protein GQR58_021330 [Nymphon striatum]|nr:hypothetical protein GQR58_021330 [Nymphon striatum]
MPGCQRLANIYSLLCMYGLSLSAQYLSHDKMDTDKKCKPTPELGSDLNGSRDVTRQNATADADATVMLMATLRVPIGTIYNKHEQENKNAYTTRDYEITEPKEKSYGLLRNGTFSGIVGDLQKKKSLKSKIKEMRVVFHDEDELKRKFLSGNTSGEEIVLQGITNKADVGLAQLAYLIERYRVVDYLSSYIGYKGVKLVYRNPDIDGFGMSTAWITSFTDPFQTTDRIKPPSHQTSSQNVLVNRKTGCSRGCTAN